MPSQEFIFSAVKRADITDLLEICRFPFKDLTCKIMAIATIQTELPEEAKKHEIGLSFYDDNFRPCVSSVASAYDLIDAVPMIKAAVYLATLEKKTGVFAIQDFIWRHKEDALSRLMRDEVPTEFRELAYVLFPFLAPDDNQTTTFTMAGDIVIKQEDYVREVYGIIATEKMDK